MTDALFLVPSVPETGTYRLDGAEGHHAADVVRLRVGETLLLGDGAGAVADCVVSAVAKGVLDVEVTGYRRVPAREPRLVVAQALAKGDRGELAVQTMTEVGVDEIVPWQAARSVVRWQGDRGARALARWRATAREAAKQSRRAWLPAVADPVGTAALAARLAGHSSYVLHEDAETPLATAPVPATGAVLLVVGPEGGVAPEELAAFTAAGATPVRLGPEVLRTSTAGVAALAVLAAVTGRWH
ncbi:ribosomal RNA small subunit methyltransferase E [Actinocatenispora thailandica]|uniref:Ribosomal RNA small subunit methyltransferase E n=1 Tax=Actinocatenispora thailandica TaxID=227318 RepID=A0A7R7DL87_9ACTN|nr:16S rRNA (uracil(1498)-N(3))-methyltransferase [Actinocatenispora thailandica]BCJ33804.1 ribosomal RNA small subunit methyltransferase E [Actinocatenispora thailandica]